MSKISYFKSLKSRVPEPAPKELEYYLQRIKDGKHEKLISQLRLEVNPDKKKELKNKDKNLKTENKWSTSANKKLMDQGTDLLTSLGNNSKTAHKIKQGLAASNAFMNTAEGVTDALADQNYPSAALIAATGAAQIAAILASSPDSPSGSITAPSAAAPEQPQERFSPEQSEIGLDFRSEESSTSNVIRFDTETGDQLIDALMGVMNDSMRNGRG